MHVSPDLKVWRDFPVRDDADWLGSIIETADKKISTNSRHRQQGNITKFWEKTSPAGKYLQTLGSGLRVWKALEC